MPRFGREGKARGSASQGYEARGRGYQVVPQVCQDLERYSLHRAKSDIRYFKKSNKKEIDMKIVDGFKLREVCGEFVVVPEGSKLVNFNKMLSLNGSAAFLWKAVEGKDFDVQTLADLLVKEYEIDSALALSDAGKILDKWVEIGVVR